MSLLLNGQNANIDNIQECKGLHFGAKQQAIGGMKMIGWKGRKDRKRLTALLLAGVMVLSGMGISPISVQAEETVEEQANEAAVTENAETVEAQTYAATVSDGNVETSGGNGTYVFDAATDKVITALEKKAVVPAGKYGTDGYFVFSGTIIRGNSGTYSAEIGKAETGDVSFTVSGKADATFTITSTSASNTSDFVLMSSDGTKIIPAGETAAIITVTGTDPAKEVKYNDLEAGTYHVCAPKDGANPNRGFRLLYASVSDVPTSVTKEYAFDASTDKVITALEKKAVVPAGKYGTDGYFVFSGTIIRGNSGTYSAEIGKAETGDVSFTVSGKADATFTITSTSASNTSDFVLMSSDGTKIIPAGETAAIITVTGTDPAKEVKYNDLEAGTYHVCAPKDGANPNRGFRLLSASVSDTTGGSRPARAEWSTVAAPAFVSAEQIKDKNDIEVKVSGVVGYDGADMLVVSMQDESGNIKEQNIAKNGTEHTVTFTPNASGKYTFSVIAKRDGETDKAAEQNIGVNFVLVLSSPVISSVTNKGNGSVSVEWGAVKEADKYIVTASLEGEETIAAKAETSDTAAILNGLTVGKKYIISVVAVRGTETSKAGTMGVNVVAEAQRVWSVSTYGSSTDTKNNGAIGSANDNKVTVYSEGGKGKIVPGSTDGLTFYYTAIDPETENFTLTATVNVDSWTISNGQEGFGLMVADAVGPNGDGTAFWNNSYQAIATKIEYYYDGEGVTNDTSASKISMKLGLGAISRTGVTADDVAAIKAGTITMPAGYVSETTTLETSAAAQGSGTYNLVGNWQKTEPTGCLDNLLTTFRLQIQRNNTGYILRYLDADNNVISEKLYYDLERSSLTQIDKDNIYVGFFASRNARITVTDIDFKTIDPKDDEAAQGREIEYVYPINNIESATFSNTADYDLVYYGNADGTLIVKNEAGNEILNKEFKALTKESVSVKLNSGKNVFTINFIPDASYKPGEYKLMTSYEPVTIQHVVEYKTVENNNIYVSPDGKAGAAGTKDAPMDIYSAVKIAKPGQKILIKEGTYNLTQTVKVERGINGTENAMIYMIADPEAASRPVFDFGGNCAGMVLAGDYWYFQGFDVTRSADAQKGVQVSGNHNVLDRIKAYKNGNTGIQISRYLSTDEFAQWPSYNTVLNCSSYLNADKGYEDADGFAAKLTVGQGNVFDGCIAAYNADDGWDLFAKVQSGSIGVVTIQNCVAFKNGYVLDENGKEIDAGNGNGFKMGGDSMPGAHVLKNSVAFANKAKGIDSNSCPDIKVFSSTTFDNESYNVAFYTNTAVNTAFAANGILSYKVSNKVAEQFKLKGTQVSSDVYGATNYYFDGSKSANADGATVAASWFTSLDTAKAVQAGGITRNADGTINMNGFLVLTEEAPEGVGARMAGQSSGIITVVPDAEKEDDSSDSDSDSDSDSSSTSSEVNWSDVGSSVADKVAEIKTNPAVASVNMNITCSGEVKVPQNVLNTIKGTNVTVAFHSGNGVALSISGQDLKNRNLSKIQNIDLTVQQNVNAIPANVVSAKGGNVNKQLTIKDTGSFGVPVNLHVNVGKENAGKYANLYRYNAEKGRLEYCGSFTVTSIGQSMFALKRGGNYLVTVTDRRPSESIWYADGDYTVKAGDTLSMIARRYHMTLAELLSKNAQITNSNVIKVGQKLNLN